MAGKRNGGSITNYGQKSRNWYVRKKLDSWNEVIEKANKDFYENRKDRVLGICWQDFNR